MVETKRSSYSVITTGVGRSDYSENIEQSVEPIIQSYQSEYHYSNTVNIGPGATEVIEVILPTNYVALIYDIYVTNPNNILVDVFMQYFTAAGTWRGFAAKQDMVTVEIHFSKSWLLSNKYRFNITNTGMAAADFTFSAHGVWTTGQIYYASIVPP